MSNLFGGSKNSTPAATPPSIDAARTRVARLRRIRGMRGRAAALLVSGSGTPVTAKREVTGN
jgi:hypothetical protein